MKEKQDKTALCPLKEVRERRWGREVFRNLQKLWKVSRKMRDKLESARVCLYGTFFYKDWCTATIVPGYARKSKHSIEPLSFVSLQQSVFSPFRKSQQNVSPWIEYGESLLDYYCSMRPRTPNHGFRAMFDQENRLFREVSGHHGLQPVNASQSCSKEVNTSDPTFSGQMAYLKWSTTMLLLSQVARQTSKNRQATGEDL